LGRRQPRQQLHEHPCDVCRLPFDCDGELERNYDGWPEVICVSFHERHSRTCGNCLVKRIRQQQERRQEA
jgi:hypothetical protein